MELFIAYKNYSSWSLRPWLLMKVAGIEFQETLFPFYHDDSLKRFAEQENIPAKVPVLKVGKQMIWDSLAIMETLAEDYPEKKLWPESRAWRVLARSVAAEMHSGFIALRSQYPMNCRRQCELKPTPESLEDIARLRALWHKFYSADEGLSAKRAKGEFLCGTFSIVDAMYALVLWRIKNYGLFVSDEFEAWSKAMLDLPAMQEWLASAKQESWQIDASESVCD